MSSHRVVEHCPFDRSLLGVELEFHWLGVFLQWGLLKNLEMVMNPVKLVIERKEYISNGTDNEFGSLHLRFVTELIFEIIF